VVAEYSLSLRKFQAPIYLHFTEAFQMVSDFRCHRVLESVWNVMAHGDAWEGEMKGKQANGVGRQCSSTVPRNTVYPANTMAAR
jgi:hypothetical protein